MAQTVEIDIGAAGDGGEGLAAHAVASDIGFEPRQRQRAGGFANAAGIVKNIFERAAHGIGIDGDDVVQQIAAHAESLFAHQLDGGAVGKQADVF